MQRGLPGYRAPLPGDPRARIMAAMRMRFERLRLAPDLAARFRVTGDGIEGEWLAEKRTDWERITLVAAAVLLVGGGGGWLTGSWMPVVPALVLAWLFWPRYQMTLYADRAGTEPILYVRGAEPPGRRYPVRAVPLCLDHGTSVI